MENHVAVLRLTAPNQAPCQEPESTVSHPSPGTRCRSEKAIWEGDPPAPATSTDSMHIRDKLPSWALPESLTFKIKQLFESAKFWGSLLYSNRFFILKRKESSQNITTNRVPLHWFFIKVKDTFSPRFVLNPTTALLRDLIFRIWRTQIRQLWMSTLNQSYLIRLQVNKITWKSSSAKAIAIHWIIQITELHHWENHA